MDTNEASETTDYTDCTNKKTPIICRLSPRNHLLIRIIRAIRGQNDYMVAWIKRLKHEDQDSVRQPPDQVLAGATLVSIPIVHS
jgi:hypothetical protein